MTDPASPATDTQSHFDVIVVGGGAAGIKAALDARAHGVSVCVLEKEERLGKKILISGGGKCNLTNTDIDLSNYHGTHPRFVADALRGFTQHDLIEWIESLGVETVSDPDNGKVWPAAMKSMAVTNALENALEDAQIAVHLRTSLQSATRSPDGLFTLSARHQPGRGGGHLTMDRCEPSDLDYTCHALILASGGISAPQLGANDSGLVVAERFGHKLQPKYPALAGITIAETWPRELAGLTAEHVAITLEIAGKPILAVTGSLLLTHYGLTSPAIFRLSREIGPALEQKLPVRLLVNWRADMYDDEADAREGIFHGLGANTKKHAGIAVGEIVRFRRLGEQLVILAGGKPDYRVRELQAKHRDALLELVFRCPFTVTGTQDWQKAEVMRGGVDVRKVDPRTMASKIVDGLFLCGEMLDIDADVGGFNFQFAFASGKAAGAAAAGFAQAHRGGSP
jgi:predicted Rossmann fold flavoprotein